MVIAEIVRFAGLGFIDIGEVIKIHTQFDQLVSVHPGLALGIEVAKDAPVFADGVVDSPHETSDISIGRLILGGPAIIRTILLVPAAMNFFSANFTYSFFGNHILVIYTPLVSVFTGQNVTVFHQIFIRSSDFLYQGLSACSPKAE